MYRLFQNLLTIYIVTLLLFSCAPKRQSLNTVNDTLSQDPIKRSDELLFLVFKIKKGTSDQDNQVILVSKQKVEGTLKRSSVATDFHGDHKLVIYQYDGARVKDSIVINHPLYPHMESYDHGHMSQHALMLDSAEFFVRFQLHGKAQQINIVETIEDSNPRTLTILTP